MFGNPPIWVPFETLSPNPLNPKITNPKPLNPKPLNARPDNYEPDLVEGFGGKRTSSSGALNGLIAAYF